MASGKTSRFTYTAANRLGEVHVAELPKAREWLAGRLHDTLFPMLKERFLPSEEEEHDSLAVYDSLVIRYDASRGGTRQPMHRDASLFSVNIALNGAFEGGGTRFEGTGEAYTMAEGHAMLHASGARHAGHPIVSGERWVLVVFVLARGAPQMARRLGERAVEHRRAGQLDEARADLEAALLLAPNDHELHHSLASVMAMQGGDDMGARARLQHASALYPPCPKPRNALGSMLLAAGRTRAALRWFESALAKSAEEDDDDGWDASVNAALCTVLLAEAAASSSSNHHHHGGSGGAASAAFAALPAARLHVWRAFASAQQDKRLLDLVDRVDTLDGRASDAPDVLPDVRAVLREAKGRQRARLGSALVRSWDSSSSGGGGEGGEGGTLVIAFAGADAALGGGINGGVPSHEFVRACRNAGVRKAIFVRDVLRAWYLRGVGREYGAGASSSGGGEESFEGVMSMLREEIARVRPSRVVTIGSSMGGYAAVRAALALGADRALAFAPQVAIDPQLRRARSLPAAPFDGLLRGLSAMGRIEGFPLESLDELVLHRQGAGAGAGAGAAAGRTTEIEIHVGDADPGDVSEARTLERAIAEGPGGGSPALTCKVKVHEARDHNLVVDMRDTGELHELLCRTVRDADGDARATAASMPSDFVGFQDCPDF